MKKMSQLSTLGLGFTNQERRVCGLFELVFFMPCRFDEKNLPEPDMNKNWRTKTESRFQERKEVVRLKNEGQHSENSLCVSKVLKKIKI